LAARGGRATARVESLVPSSVAGIIALASGEVPPLASSLADFKAMPRDEGGVFEAVARAGGRCFVAGPSLWTELYGRWIAAAEVDPSFGRADERLIGATLRALESDAHRLIVLHLGRVDAVAHQYGTRSPEYRAAARWCDAAVGRIARAMGPDAALVVTSDHGNVDRGGHAGPEPSVLRTPLVMFGPGLPTGSRPAMPQRAVRSLLLSALGCHGDATAGVPAGARREGNGSWFPLPLASALLSGLSFWSGLRGAQTGRRHATVLNLTVWLLLALMVLGWFPAALAAGFAALAWAAFSVPGRISARLVAAGGLGTALGALRLVDGFVVLDRATPDGMIPTLIGVAVLACGLLPFSPPGGAGVGRALRAPPHRAVILGQWLGVVMGAAAAAALGRVRLMLAYLAAVVLGRALGRLLGSPPAGTPAGSAGAARCVAVGMLTAAAVVLLGRAAGETTSLSTVDVRAAFALVDGRFGLILAIVAVAAAQALPSIGLVLGLRSGVARLASDPATEFAAGLAAALVGQAAVGVLLLNAARDQTVAALALGLTARVGAETLYLFLGLAALILASGPAATPREWIRNRIEDDLR
ncbi:MAG TPA: alkaline phosphatase family protein, partial [Isosphaeraceae bacterium]